MFYTFATLLKQLNQKVMNVANFIITFLFGIATGVFCALFFSKLIDFIGGMMRKTKPKQPVTTTESCYKMCNLCRHYKPRGIVSVNWTCKEGIFGGNSKLCDLVNVARNCESFEHYSEHY